MANDNVNGAQEHSSSGAAPVGEVQPVSASMVSGLLVSLIVWGCFACAAILAVGMMQEQSRRVGAQEEKLAMERTKQVAQWMAEKQAVETQLAEVKRALAALRASQAEQADGVETLRTEVAERKQRIEAMGAEIKDILEQLPAGGETKAVVAVKPTGPKAVPLADRVKELAELRKKWAAAYSARMGKLQVELIAKMVAKEPIALQTFYLQYTQSPFAPAALFAAAEGWFRLRELDKARLNYSALIAAYPESEYCKDCNERLVQVEAKKQFIPLPQGAVIRLYKPVESVR